MYILMWSFQGHNFSVSMDMNSPCPYKKYSEICISLLLFFKDYVCKSWKLFKDWRFQMFWNLLNIFSQNQHLQNWRNMKNLELYFCFTEWFPLLNEECFRSQYLTGLKIMLWISTRQWRYVKPNLNGSGESRRIPGLLMCRNFWLLLKPILYIPPLCLNMINLTFSIFNFQSFSFFKGISIGKITYSYSNRSATLPLTVCKLTIK